MFCRRCIHSLRQYSTSANQNVKSPDSFTSMYFSSPSTTMTTSQTSSSSAASFFNKRSRLLYSAPTLKDHPYNIHVPEILLLGASNVGKSTFLNALVGVPNTARVGPRPGKTTLMNAYGTGPNPNIAKNLISPGTPSPKHSLIVMDTPGYGFKSQTTWGDAIVKYMTSRKALKGAVLLLSSEKKRILKEDRMVLEKLAETNTRTLAVLTKADKTGYDWMTHCASLAAAMQEEFQAVQKSVNPDWSQGSGWVSDVFVTAAGMKGARGNAAGLGGVRSAVLDMAGIHLEEQADPEAKPASENKAYSGKIVSFDDIQWKS